jgi:hypothetical protein
MTTIVPKKVRHNVISYLLGIIPREDKTRFTETSISEIYRVALSEVYNHAEKYYHYNKKAAIRDWFQGLGMNVDFTYFDIARRMRAWGYTVNEDDEEDYYNKCDLWWDILATVVYEEGR